MKTDYYYCILKELVLQLEIGHVCNRDTVRAASETVGCDVAVAVYIRCKRVCNSVRRLVCTAAVNKKRRTG